MLAYIRENKLSDHTPQDPSITYDVIVEGSLSFLESIKSSFKDYDFFYHDGFKANKGVIEYCSSCSRSEAETLLDGIKRKAIQAVTNWQ